MLIHGDIRADNLFFAGDGMKVVDFQLAARGAGATDIGYLVSQGLPTDVRAGRDEALVREYLDGPLRSRRRRLPVRRGVAALPLRRRLLGGAARRSPLLGWDALPERSRQLCMRLMDRAVAAIDEIDALEVFA